MMMNAILCMDQSGFIGAPDGSLLYRIKSDLNRFKLLTKDQTVVMGRKTYESLGVPFLEDRANVVLTRDPNYVAKDPRVVVVHSIEELGKRFADSSIELCNMFIIGGAEIYKQFAPYIDIYYVTIVYNMGDIPIPEGSVKLPTKVYQAIQNTVAGKDPYYKLKAVTSFVPHDCPCSMAEFICIESPVSEVSNATPMWLLLLRDILHHNYPGEKHPFVKGVAGGSDNRRDMIEAIHNRMRD